MAFKFQNTAEIGDTIRAYDFEPMPDRPDMFVEGIVVAKGPTEHGFFAYTIECNKDSRGVQGRRVGQEVFVPYEMFMSDFDGRVTKIS